MVDELGMPSGQGEEGVEGVWNYEALVEGTCIVFVCVWGGGEWKGRGGLMPMGCGSFVYMVNLPTFP